MSATTIAPRAVRLIANYLPQFHPTPENDRFWGPGFTEWTNVAKARPLFPGHYQPHVPADLGFYDLRVPEVRERQAEMARAAGIEAFCYWHYWFGNGRMILERPLQEVARSGRPDFPFCVGWANESWTGIWHGAANRTLIEQVYPGERDWIAHFEYLLPLFLDPRYVRVDGRPLFLLFRPAQLPECSRFLECWRELAVRHGLPGLHMVAYEQDHWPPAQHGFDAATWAHQSIMRWVYRDAHARAAERASRGVPVHVYDYAEAVPWMHGERTPAALGDDHYPSIVCGWDNSPRSGAAATILHGYHPELFRRQARQVMRRVLHKPWEHRLVFVKSWNEWAEGNYLEPEVRYGRAYLEVLREEVDALHDPTGRPPEPRTWEERSVPTHEATAAHGAPDDADGTVAALLARIEEAGCLPEALLLQPRADRIAGPAFALVQAAAHIVRAGRGGGRRLRLLDVGGGLNHDRVRPIVTRACESVVVVSPATPRMVHTGQAMYVDGELFELAMPGARFDLVTCIADGARHDMVTLARRVAPGGRLIACISLAALPEAHSPDGATGPEAIRFLAGTFERDGLETAVALYKLIPGAGWVPATLLDPDVLREAGRPAVVAILEGARR